MDFSRIYLIDNQDNCGLFFQVYLLQAAFPVLQLLLWKRVSILASYSFPSYNTFRQRTEERKAS